MGGFIAEFEVWGASFFLFVAFDVSAVSVSYGSRLLEYIESLCRWMQRRDDRKYNEIYVWNELANISWRNGHGWEDLNTGLIVCVVVKAQFRIQSKLPLAPYPRNTASRVIIPIAFDLSKSQTPPRNPNTCEILPCRSA